MATTTTTSKLCIYNRQIAATAVGRRTVDFVGALLRPRVSGGRGVDVFRFGRPITVEEHHEHDDEHHGDGHHGHGEYPHELHHQLVVLQSRRLQWSPRRFGRRRSVPGRRRRRFSRVHGAAFDVRPVRLVHDRGLPRGRLESYGSTQHPESCRARTVCHHLVCLAFGCAVAAVVGFAFGAVAVVVGFAYGVVAPVVGFAYGAVAATAASDSDSDCLPGGQPTSAAAAENRQSAAGRFAASGAVVAVRARLVAGVCTVQAPAPDVTL